MRKEAESSLASNFSEWSGRQEDSSTSEDMGRAANESGRARRNCALIPLPSCTSLEPKNGRFDHDRSVRCGNVNRPLITQLPKNKKNAEDKKVSCGLLSFGPDCVIYSGCSLLGFE